MDHKKLIGFLGLGAAVASMSRAAKDASIAIEGAADTMAEMIPLLRRPNGSTGRKSYGTRYSGPTRMIKKELPNGKFTLVPEPPVPEYIGARMYATRSSKTEMRRKLNFISKAALPPADANRVLAAEAKRARKADRNLTLAFRGAFN